jgi:hypothetical protein
MPTPQHCLINVVADRPTTHHHHNLVCEEDALHALVRCAPRIAKYISPKKPGHSPKKPSAIPGGSPAQIPGGSPAQIPVGLAQGLPPGTAMGLPLGFALGSADDVYFIGGQP